MLTAVTRTFAQLFDPAMTGVLWRSLLWSAVAFLAAVFALASAGGAIGLPHVLGFLPHWILQALGAVLGLVLTAWLFVPFAAIIASLYLERIARAVETRWYPDLPSAKSAPVAAQLWDGVVLGITLLVLNILALVLTLLIPGIGFFAGLFITAYGIARGFFVAVAMRRMSRADAAAQFNRAWFPVMGVGILLALLATVPLLNLLLPVAGIAAMVHLCVAGLPRRDLETARSPVIAPRFS